MIPISALDLQKQQQSDEAAIKSYYQEATNVLEEINKVISGGNTPPEEVEKRVINILDSASSVGVLTYIKPLLDRSMPGIWEKYNEMKLFTKGGTSDKISLIAASDYTSASSAADSLAVMLANLPIDGVAKQQYMENLKKLQTALNAAQQMQQVQVTPTPPPAGQTANVAPGVASMFNTPETIAKVAELLSKAESGQPVDKVMEDIRSITGLDKEAFWKALAEMNKQADGNPFVDGGKGDSKGDDKGEEKEDKGGGDKKANPFEKKEDKGGEKKEDKKEDKKEGEDKGEEKEEKSESKESKEPKKESKEPAEKKSEPKSEPKKESKEEKPEPKKKSKSEKKAEKRFIRDMEKVIKMVEKLMEQEKGEDSEQENLKTALNLLKEFLEEEQNEDEECEGMPEDMEDMEGMEKTGPDIPPIMEGLALPMEPKNEIVPGVSTIEMEQIPALPMPMASKNEWFTAEGKATPGAQEFIKNKITLEKARDKGYKAPKKKAHISIVPHEHIEKIITKNEPGKGREIGETAPVVEKGDVAKPQPRFELQNKTELKVNDFVWRKAENLEGFANVGDEPGRIVDEGNGKFIVDWGHDDGIPTEEEPQNLIIAERAAGEEGVFTLPQESQEIELDLDANPDKGPMGTPEAVEQVLRETSLHDLLVKHAKESHREEGTIRHIASGKEGQVLARYADGILLVSIEGKELKLWPCEVE